MFLGPKLGIINLVDCKYEIFKTLYREQLSFFWLPHEISMVRDKSDIENFTESELFIFESNLAFQTLGDSFLSNGIDTILKYVTLNELYMTLSTHAFFESAIHTISYSTIIEGIYNNPAEKFQSILKNEEILKRAVESTSRFDQLLNSTSEDPKLEIVNTLVGLLALEAISFYNSFLTSFYFAKNGKATGAGQIIKLIARDENLHKANTINILKLLMKREDEGFSHLKDQIIEKITSTFYQMAQQEMNWAEHLFSKGELPGLTCKAMKRYIQYLSNRAILDVGLRKEHQLFDEVVNPFNWVASYQGAARLTQTAAQEQEIVNYVKSSKNDLADFEF